MQHHTTCIVLVIVGRRGFGVRRVGVVGGVVGVMGRVRVRMSGGGVSIEFLDLASEF